MRLVEFLGRDDGVERPGVKVDGKEYLLDRPVVVSEKVAGQLKSLSGYKFKITDAPEGHIPEEEEAPLGGSAGGFGGSQGSVEVEPAQDQESN